MKISKEEKEQVRLVNKNRELHHKELLKEEKKSHQKSKVAPSDDIIILKNVNKIYPNHVQAVYNFDLSIKENEFIVLVGPSGCGKSTTLKMIAGLEDITCGDLYINGKYANYMLSKDRNLAMVFQSYALYPNMTVYKNIAFPLTIRGESKEVIHEKVMKIANILELDKDLLKRRPAALSGGQRQRVALARAMVKGSKILLMDEPLSNLDAKLRASVRTEIVDLHRKINATTIYVTHDQVEAMTMSDRLVVMNNGFVEQIGTPQEIYDFPKSLFVATFIGSPAMNILPAKLFDNQIKLENDFSLELNKQQIKAVDDYYQNIIQEINNDIESTKAKIKQREVDLSKVGYIKDLESLDKLSSKYAKKIATKKLSLSSLSEQSEKYQKLSDEIDSLNKEFNEKYNLLDQGINQKQYQVLDEVEVKKLVEQDENIKTYNFELSKQQDMLKQYQEVKDSNLKNVFFGVRAEDLFLDIDKSNFAKQSKAMKIHIDLCELLGHEYFIVFKVNNIQCTLKASAYEEILPNRDLDAYINVEKIHIFDPISKRSIF